jgi:mono/diheme cytochrome c family protein
MGTSRVTIFVTSLAIAISACTGDIGVRSTTSPVATHPGDPLAGAESYEPTCSTCHAADLSGVGGLGGPLSPNTFVESSTEAEIVDLIIGGVPRDHPGNTMGVDMAPRGGNPSLTDQNIRDISAYLKSQN